MEKLGASALSDAELLAILIGSGSVKEDAVTLMKRLLADCHPVLANATILAVCHNHPSNSVKPSKKDDQLTEHIKKGCDIMRILFLDHVIITDGNYYSYHEEGRC